jgi:hypothetical protein
MEQKSIEPSNKRSEPFDFETVTPGTYAVGIIVILFFVIAFSILPWSKSNGQQLEKFPDLSIFTESN